MIKALRLVAWVCLALASVEARATLYSWSGNFGAGYCSNPGFSSFSNSSIQSLANAILARLTATGCPNTSYFLTSSNATTGVITGGCTGSACGSSTTWSATATMTAGCPASGTVVSSGYFDYGTTAVSGPPGLVCASGCLASFNGHSPAGRALVEGVYRYFAYGKYQYFGEETCSGGTYAAPGSASATVPGNTCGSDTVPTEINGQIKCVVKTTGVLASTQPAEIKQATATTTATGGDGSVTRTSTTTYADGSQAVKTETYPNSTATVPAAVTTQVLSGAGTIAAGQNAGAVAGAAGGTGSGWPSDYSRTGEASAAADSINATLGPKLDKLVETSAAPGDLTVPGNESYTDFGNTFSSLVGWQVPGHTSQCPTASFTAPWATSYTIDAHCQLITNHWGALQAAMIVVWTVAGLFVVLRA